MSNLFLDQLDDKVRKNDKAVILLTKHENNDGFCPSISKETSKTQETIWKSVLKMTHLIREIISNAREFESLPSRNDHPAYLRTTKVYLGVGISVVVVVT